MAERSERSHWKEVRGVEKIRDNENTAFHNHQRENGEKKGRSNTLLFSMEVKRNSKLGEWIEVLIMQNTKWYMYNAMFLTFRIVCNVLFKS